MLGNGSWVLGDQSFLTCNHIKVQASLLTVHVGRCSRLLDSAIKDNIAHIDRIY